MGKKGSLSWKPAVAAFFAVGLAGGCTHLVHVEDLDARFAEVNRALDEHDARITALEGLAGEVTQLRDDVAGLEDQLNALRAEFEECGCGGMALGLPVYFDFDSSDIRPIDATYLNDFAQAMLNNHPDALLTVEGFADPAGSAAYNIRLGRQRAENVMNQLVSAGMNSNRVRAVSYGEIRNRQVVPGAQGPGTQGIENRRVTFVIEWAPGREAGGALPGFGS